jgi:hypothetical protein
MICGTQLFLHNLCLSKWIVAGKGRAERWHELIRTAWLQGNTSGMKQLCRGGGRNTPCRKWSNFGRRPADAFVITDDFMSAGRISGALSIPIPQLKVGQFHTVSGSRLQVNQSQIRYKTELEYLTSIL